MRCSSNIRGPKGSNAASRHVLPLPKAAKSCSRYPMRRPRASETLPEFGFKRPVRIRKRLVFPEPFSPNRVILSLGLMVSETSSRTVLSGKKSEILSSRASTENSFAYEACTKKTLVQRCPLHAGQCITALVSTHRWAPAHGLRGRCRLPRVVLFGGPVFRPCTSCRRICVRSGGVCSIQGDPPCRTVDGDSLPCSYALGGIRHADDGRDPVLAG